MTMGTTVFVNVKVIKVTIVVTWLLRRQVVFRLLPGFVHTKKHVCECNTNGAVVVSHDMY